MSNEATTTPTAAELAAAAAPDLTRAVMADTSASTIDLDGDGRNAEPAVVDEARAAIYAKHSERRQEELSSQAETPDDEITVKVNGKERKVTREKIDAAGGVDAYQKNAAASEILNQASAEARRVKEESEALERRRQELDAREQRLSQATPQPATTPTPRLPTEEPAGANKTLARQYHDALLDGDIDKADELLLKINAAPGATAINPEEIATRAVRQAKAELTAEDRKKQAARFEAERQEAAAEFPIKHKDLASNPDAHNMVDDKTLEVYREHPDWGPKAIVDEAADRVRKMIKAVAAPTTTSEKLDLKRRSANLRTGSARSVNRPAPKPQTNSEYVANLRAARGLPT